MKNNLIFYICDDNIDFAQKIKQEIKKITINKRTCEICIFDNGRELIKKWDSQIADAVFLDIDMPEINGFELAEQIQKRKEDAYIIFITNHEDKVYQSYEYGDGKFGADDSVTYEQLSLLLKRLFNYDETNTQPTAAKREYIITALVKALGADISSVDENVITQKFSDGETITDDNRKYIAYAVNSKLAVGYGGKHYTDSNVTRAETAVLLSRAVELNK